MTTTDCDVVVIGGGIVGAAISAGLVRGGARVAIVERGPAELAAQTVAMPRLDFPRRRHVGSERARNHVLGGNGHYWGGGLMRPPSLRLDDVLGHAGLGPTKDTDLEAHFAAVERRYGLVDRPARGPVPSLGDGAFVAADIAVLPGRSRNVARFELDSVRRNPRGVILPEAAIEGFEVDRSRPRRRVRAVLVRLPDSKVRLAARAFVIAAGVVDSNLIVQQHAAVLSNAIDTATLGTRLHDHWSVPIARIHLGDDAALHTLLAPRFRGRAIFGRHFEMQSASGWGARGFLHFTFSFDEASPYREIKRLMLLRQQGARPAQLVAGALSLLSRLLVLGRVGWERWWRRRLYLARDLAVTATLDFEAFPHPTNSLRLTREGATFDWGFSAEDDVSFSELAAQCRALLAALQNRHAMSVEPLYECGSDDSAIAYFHRAAADAFHLGGGLAAGYGAADALDGDLRLRGTDNLYVISTAAFCRPGAVNPTHSLLALADRFVSEFLSGRLGGGAR